MTPCREESSSWRAMVSVVRTELSKCPRRESACPRQSVLAGSTERSSPRSETRTNNETMRISRRNQSKSPTDHDNDGQTNKAERLSRSEAGARRPAAALKWHAAGASKARISSIGGKEGGWTHTARGQGSTVGGKGVCSGAYASAGWGGRVTAASTSTLALVMSAARETDQRVRESVC